MVTLSAARPVFTFVTGDDRLRRLCAFYEAGAVFTVLVEAGADYPHVTEEDTVAPAFESGVDLVTLATGALATSDWPHRVAEDRPLDAFDFEATLLPTAEPGDHEVPEPAD